MRSLWGTRINAGVWGTAAFPSVYRTDVHPFAFLPHSIRWQALSFFLAVAGAIVGIIGGHRWAATILLATGGVGLAATVAKNITYAWRSDVASLLGVGAERRRHPVARAWARLWYRALVAHLHFIQPFARIRGRIRGLLSPPEVAQPAGEPQTSRGPRPSLGEAWRALLLISGSVTEDRFWSETWTSAERVLVQLTEWFRASRAVRAIAVDEGWSDDRDVSVFIGRWAWLDIRAMVEDHGGGKSLVRIGMHLRPTTFGIVTALWLGFVLLAGAAAGFTVTYTNLPVAFVYTARDASTRGLVDSLGRVVPWAARIVAVLTLALVAAVAWRTAQTTAIARRGIKRVTIGNGMVAMRSGSARVPLLAPAGLSVYGLRSAIIFVVMILSLGAGTFMLREAATGPVIGGRKGFGGDYGLAMDAWLDAPGGIAVAPNGDLFIADSNNDVIRRADARDNNLYPYAGDHDSGSGFSGDNGPAISAQLDTPDGVDIAPDGDEKPATEAALNTPSAVAVDQRTGNIYIADTLNYRIRMVDAKTGLIHTIAGNGTPGEGQDVGDGGPATSAHLNMPSDVELDARTGDLYIADMHHNRIRRVDAKTQIITTVAGSGEWGDRGDDGPAIKAQLAGPAGVAVVPEPGGKVTIFIADYYNGHVRAVGPDGIIRDLSDEGRTAFGAPTRVAYAATGPHRGWLYVTDSSEDKVVPLIIPKIAPNLVPPRPIAPARRVGG